MHYSCKSTHAGKTVSLVTRLVQPATVRSKEVQCLSQQDSSHLCWDMSALRASTLAPVISATCTASLFNGCMTDADRKTRRQSL